MNQKNIIDVGLPALMLDADFSKESASMNDVKSLTNKLKFRKYITM